jgi:molybdopterin-guanine dinucleotide biosynthesis protein A
MFDVRLRAEYDHLVESVSAIILAGGQSRRMGRDKALIDYDGKPIIAHVIDLLRELSEDVIVVSNRSETYAPFGARIVPDYDPPGGPLGGIYTGLSAAKNDLAIVVACDMPFLNRSLLRHLIDRAQPADAVVMLTDGEYEPLHAVYRRTCLPSIQDHLLKGDRRVISFFDDVRLATVPADEWRVIDPSGQSIANLNTPEDLQQLQ